MADQKSVQICGNPWLTSFPHPATQTLAAERPIDSTSSWTAPQPADLTSLSRTDTRLLAEFEHLWDAAEEIWTAESEDAPFHAYVSADYRDVFARLLSLKGNSAKFLEWGSGLGVVAIMASRMGFDAYGIEAEAKLVDHAEALAEQFDSNAQFVVGSFIPDAFDWPPTCRDLATISAIDMADGYQQLNLELRDFGLVYGYPWPTERDLLDKVMNQFGAPDSLLLTYDVRKGTELKQAS